MTKSSSTKHHGKGESMSLEYYMYHDKEENEYFLVEVYENKVTLKVKRDGWGDIWSLPLEQVKGPQ